MDLFQYPYLNQDISFELKNGNVMVNATEMAKAFKKEVARFMENQSTQNFIEACIKTQNSSFLAIEKKEDLVVSKQRSELLIPVITGIK